MGVGIVMDDAADAASEKLWGRCGVAAQVVFCRRRRFDGVVKKGLVFSWGVSKVAGTKKHNSASAPRHFFLGKVFYTVTHCFFTNSISS